MKLGIHLSTFTPGWGDDVLPFIDTAAQIGYDAVEIPLMYPDAFDAAGARQRLREHHLACTCGTGLNPAEDISSLDADIRRKGMERLLRCTQLCEELGSDCLGGVLYAPWGLRTPRTQFAANRAWAVECLRSVADQAAHRGVTLSLEVLNRYESSFVNTIAEGRQLLAEIGCRNVRLHFDTFHAHIEEKNLAQAIRAGGADIFHVHLCDNNRGAPGSGAIDFDAVLDALREIGYTRYLMVENFVVPDCEAGSEVCVWRREFASPQEDAVQAYRYISGLMRRKGIRECETV